MKQTSHDLRKHLDEQLTFLESSVSAYDKGNTSEAKRLAVTLRVLLHDTRHSLSLLGQLGMKSELLYDSSSFARYNETPWDVAVYTGLIGHCIDVRTGRISFIPILDRTGDDPPQWVGFEEWWNMVVIKDEVGNTFTRRDLVLTMANKDGGAHVDPVITDKYAAISRQNSLGWRGSIGKERFSPIPEPERAAVRQISHELLKSLDPKYTKEVKLGGPYGIIFNVVVVKEPLKENFSPTESCPCGSGEEYQHCHGQGTPESTK